ncbi:glycosyltransferase [Salinimicrobium gaetbulicola]|uniref:Glycosyltransferase n=1 Tax=Salinimicrobium gaetbulicola TaxID=999702 RepID=A0ABW3IFM6_9FLAO
MKDQILYVVGGRSFSSKNPGRKIGEVISVWQKIGVEVHTQFGRDIIEKNDSEVIKYGSQHHYDAKYRNIKWLSLLVNSYSELRDITHNFKLYKKLKKEYKQKDLNLIWERSARLHFSGLKLAQKKNVPFVLEWKDNLLNYKYSFFKFLASYYEKKKLNEADFIVVESSVLKNQLISQGIESAKIKVALNAVNPNEFKKEEDKGLMVRKELNIPQSEIVVGYLGSYAFYHNTSLLVKAAKLTLEKSNNITFVLVGNGKEYKECKALAKEFNLPKEKFMMLDGIDKELVPHYLSMMDITILPGSTDIICPIKIMEYMAAETVVLAPDYECNREVIKDEVNGILFESNNELDLSEKIASIENDQSMQEKLKNNARQYVVDNLTWEQTWGDVLLKTLQNEAD